MDGEALRSIGLILAGIAAVAGLLAIGLLALVIWQARKIDVPEGAGFVETLQHTPLVVVLFLDTLDLALDILAAPIAWIVLDRIGLKALRGVSALEALIPFTNFIPTMTLAWIGARLLGPRVAPASLNQAIYQTEKPPNGTQTIIIEGEKSPEPDSGDWYKDFS